MKDSKFVDLALFAEVKQSQPHAHGRLIKARHVASAGSQKIESVGSEDQPTVITHSDGDVVKEIEVVCSCGASTTISLEYPKSLHPEPDAQ